jgi:hypothetical protein
MSVESAALAIEHLRLRLRPLNRALRGAVERQGRAAARLLRPDLTPLCITDDQVQILLDDAEALLRDDRLPGTAALLTAEETNAEDGLRQRSAAAGAGLPLDRLARQLNLTAFEQEAVLLCAAPELDRSYERIYAYILDDLNRRWPCIELLSALTAESLTERLARRRALGRFGKLRRAGVLQAPGEPATELRQELRLSPGVFELLIGAADELLGQLRDPAEIASSADIVLPPGVDRQKIARLGHAIGAGWITALGLWGPRHSGKDEAALAIAAAAARPLRQFLPQGAQHPAEQERKIIETLQTAAALGALLLIATDPLNEPGNEHAHRLLTDQLAATQLPVILTGTHPWRPVKLLAARAYTELELAAPNYAARKTLWEQALPGAAETPGIQPEQAHDLAARFCLSGTEVRAAARMARTQAQLASNGHRAPLSEQLETACAAVTRQHSQRFATVVKPKRGPADLILPSALHTQVLEVARFFRAWPRVAEDWGFGRLQTGEGGIKALFTGDSGTGKTLAAEVIAGQLAMPLLKVDLARVVSKWVGETEKHLEAAFHEAEESHAVLFFDEADALFGKRGEVQHGTDRYANLEVSYLLQRLEEHYGLVILASNLRDNIDAAFTRRFQVVIHFPRPEPAERRRIWELAFPPGAPVEGGLDFDLLARLDLTGAGIVGAARTAALLAADEGGAAITMPHVVCAIARQYRREARLLTASELGPYAAFLQEAR